MRKILGFVIALSAALCLSSCAKEGTGDVQTRASAAHSEAKRLLTSRYESARGKIDGMRIPRDARSYYKMKIQAIRDSEEKKIIASTSGTSRTNTASSTGGTRETRPASSDQGSQDRRSIASRYSLADAEEESFALNGPSPSQGSSSDAFTPTVAEAQQVESFQNGAGTSARQVNLASANYRGERFIEGTKQACGKATIGLVAVTGGCLLIAVGGIVAAIPTVGVALSATAPAIVCTNVAFVGAVIAGACTAMTAAIDAAFDHLQR